MADTNTSNSLLERFMSKAKGIADQTKLTLPKEYYRYAPCICWKCNKKIIVFSWPGQEIHSEIPPERQPVPLTLQNKFSRAVNGKYWVNVCPYCNNIQGDYFLYREPDGPFWGFECGPDTHEEFKNDLKKLAEYADYSGNL